MVIELSGFCDPKNVFRNKMLNFLGKEGKGYYDIERGRERERYARVDRKVIKVL